MASTQQILHLNSNELNRNLQNINNVATVLSFDEYDKQRHLFSEESRLTYCRALDFASTTIMPIEVLIDKVLTKIKQSHITYLTSKPSTVLKTVCTKTSYREYTIEEWRSERGKEALIPTTIPGFYFDITMGYEGSNTLDENSDDDITCSNYCDICNKLTNKRICRLCTTLLLPICDCCNLVSFYNNCGKCVTCKGGYKLRDKMENEKFYRFWFYRTVVPNLMLDVHKRIRTGLPGGFNTVVDAQDDRSMNVTYYEPVFGGIGLKHSIISKDGKYSDYKVSLKNPLYTNIKEMPKFSNFEKGTTSAGVGGLNLNITSHFENFGKNKSLKVDCVSLQPFKNKIWRVKKNKSSMCTFGSSNVGAVKNSSLVGGNKTKKWKVKNVLVPGLDQTQEIVNTNIVEPMVQLVAPDIKIEPIELPVTDRELQLLMTGNYLNQQTKPFVKEESYTNYRLDRDAEINVLNRGEVVRSKRINGRRHNEGNRYTKIKNVSGEQAINSLPTRDMEYVKTEPVKDSTSLSQEVIENINPTYVREDSEAYTYSLSAKMLFYTLRKKLSRPWISNLTRTIVNFIGFKLNASRIFNHDYVIEILRFVDIEGQELDVRNINDLNFDMIASDPIYVEFSISMRSRITRRIFNVKIATASLELMCMLLHPQNTILGISEKAAIVKMKAQATKIAKLNIPRFTPLLFDNVPDNSLMLSQHYFIKNRQEIEDFHLEGVMPEPTATYTDTNLVLHTSLYQNKLRVALTLLSLILMMNQTTRSQVFLLGRTMLEQFTQKPIMLILGTLFPALSKELGQSLLSSTQSSFKLWSNTLINSVKETLKD